MLQPRSRRSSEIPQSRVVPTQEIEDILEEEGDISTEEARPYANNIVAFRKDVDMFESIFESLADRIKKQQNVLVVAYKNIEKQETKISEGSRDLQIDIIEVSNQISELGGEQAPLDTKELKKLQEQKTALEKTIAELKKQNEELQLEKTKILENLTLCDVTSRSMRAYAENAMTRLQKIQTDFDELPEEEEETKEGKEGKEGKTQHQQELQRAKDLEAVLNRVRNNPYGVFTMIRIKCDQIIRSSADRIPKKGAFLKVTTDENDNDILELLTEQETKELDLSKPFPIEPAAPSERDLKKEKEGTRVVINHQLHPTVQLQRDNDLNACSQNTTYFMQNEIKADIKRDKGIIERLLNTTVASARQDLKSNFLSAYPDIKQWYQHWEIKLETQADFSIKSNVLPSFTGPLTTITHNGTTYGNKWQSFENASSNIKIAERSTWGPEITDIVKNDVRDLKTSYEILTYLQATISDLRTKYQLLLESFSMTLQSGAIFLTNDLLQFLSDQRSPGNPLRLDRPDDLLDTVTILPIGGSHSGKTTISSSLFSSVLSRYLTSYSQFMKQAKVDISFEEIYSDEAGNPRKRFLSTKPRELHGLLQDFVPPPKQESAGEWTNICMDCKNLVAKELEVLEKIKHLNFNSESRRTKRKTLNNPDGSSRSIKIIRLRFTWEPNVVKYINLLDTGGYEKYDTQVDSLTNYYKTELAQLFANQKNQVQLTANLQQIFETLRIPLPETREEQISVLSNQIVKEVLIEGRFIRDSITYMEEVIKLYRDLQRSRRKNPNMTSKFFTEQIQLKTQKELDWMTEFVPLNSTLILLTTFKRTMDHTEIDSAKSTLKLLHDVLPGSQVLQPPDV